MDVSVDYKDYIFQFEIEAGILRNVHVAPTKATRCKQIQT
jgi:hypothetical protein